MIRRAESRRLDKGCFVSLMPRARMNRYIAFGLLAACGIARATDAAPADVPDPDGWHYVATLYGYFPAIHGETEFPGGATGPAFKINAHTIVSNLNMAFMGRLQARKGAWGLLADWIYTDISGRVGATRDFDVPGVPIPVGVTGRFGLHSKSSLLTLAGTWRFASGPRHHASLVFGARMDDTRQKLDWQLSSALPGLPEFAGQTRVAKTQWDAIVGLLGREYPVRDTRWFIPYYVDVGTGDSKFTGQLAAGIGYTWAWGEATAGWRYIDYQFKAGSPISRIAFSGPAVGLAWRF